MSDNNPASVTHRDGCAINEVGCCTCPAATETYFTPPSEVDQLRARVAALEAENAAMRDAWEGTASYSYSEWREHVAGDCHKDLCPYHPMTAQSTPTPKEDGR